MDADIFQMCLDKGHEVNHQTGYGNNLVQLYVATCEDQEDFEDVVKVLLEAGFDLGLLDG